MELLQLKYFKALAETEHLTRAAEMLFISPPALSNAIKRLESELGTTLFDRLGRNIKLNKRGHIYLHYVNQIFTALDKAGREIAEPGYNNPTISVCVTSPIIWQNLFRAFIETYPKVALSHYFVELNQIKVEDLRIKYDFLLTCPSDINNSKLESIILYSDDIPMLIVNKYHRFANRSQIDLNEVKDEPFIAITKGQSSRKYFDELFTIAGIEPKIIMECGHTMRHEMVASGRGIALSTRNAEKSNLIPNVKFIKIVNPYYRRSQALFWHSEHYHTQTAALFREFAICFFKTHSLTTSGSTDMEE